MNNKHILKAGIIVALASMPLYADEVEGKAALKACAEALTTKLEAKQGRDLDYNVAPESKGISQKLKNREVIYLDAKAHNSDEIIARANCVVNGDATVTELVALPLNAPEARVRARKMY